MSVTPCLKPKNLWWSFERATYRHAAMQALHVVLYVQLWLVGGNLLQAQAPARYPLGMSWAQPSTGASTPAITPLANSLPLEQLTGLDDRAQNLTPVFRDLPSMTAPEVTNNQNAMLVESTVLENNQTLNLPQADSYFYAEVQPDFRSVVSYSSHLPSVPPIFALSAVNSSQGQNLAASYHARSEAVRQSPTEFIQDNSQDLPADFQPWWGSKLQASVGQTRGQLAISLNDLLQNALQYSPHIQVAATQPHIKQTYIFEESAQFDWTSFLDSKYDDTNDPIGNTLTTGNNDDRFTQEEWYARGGVKRTNRHGGDIELSQRLGHLDNNSRFLIPRNQGSSRLELNYRQPLMRGRGRAVNESLIVLADLDFKASSDEFLLELQQHLKRVTETYWELVRSRSEYLQRTRLLESAETILAQLKGRSEADAMQRQIYRARAAVAERRAEIVRSRTSIRNAESRLRLLVNDPTLENSRGMELIPMEMPNLARVPVNAADAISTALANRADISKSIRDVRAATVRNGVARNEVLPKLDFLVGAYVAGLDGDSEVLNSWVKQFRDGRPGFNVGFEFEMPVGNRAAQTRQKRRQWEMNRTLHQFRAVTETALNEVEIAVREVATTYQEMTGRYHSMVAAGNETNFLLDRFKLLPEVDDSVTLLLEDLLDSQERVADEEAALAKAQFDYAVAIVQLKQVTGVLFKVHGQ